MAKIIYDDGSEEEIELINVGADARANKTITYRVIKDPAADLNAELVAVMQNRQFANLLPYEIINGILLAIGSSDIFEEIAQMAYAETGQDLNNEIEAISRKWGLSL
jgi:hypothetical protein